jgi:hypothetical protein
MDAHPPCSSARTAGPRSHDATILLSGVKNILTCDGGDVVAGIVTFVLSQRWSLRLAAAVLHRARETPVADAVMLLNGIRCFIGVHQTSSYCGAVTVARLENERRAIGEFMRLAPGQPWNELVFGWHPQLVLDALPDLIRTVSKWRRIARISRVVGRRYDAFRAYRVIELLFYYQRYVRLLATHTFQMAVMSSHSNPHGIALNLAARRSGVPVVLITHGMPISPIARLDYDLAIMECEASADVYRRAGCRLGRVVIKSRKRDHLPMTACLSSRGPLTIGIFLSKDPAEDQLVRLIRTLLADETVKRILVRPHPVNLWPGLASCLAAADGRRICLSAGASIFDDLGECDVVIAGNSTVHVEAVIAGTPSCYLRGLDHAPYDVQSFVQDGLVYELQPSRRFDPSEVVHFYARREWPGILRRYANVDQDEGDVARVVTEAVNNLAAGRAS